MDELIYGEVWDWEKVTLEKIHKLEQLTGIHVEFKGSHPVSLRIPCSLPGMEVLLPLFLNRKPEEDGEQPEENDEV